MSLEPPGRRIGIDWGSKRFGVALSDGLGMTAGGLTCLRGKEDAVVPQIVALVREHGAVELVVGLPRNMDASDGPQAAKARAFAAKLEALLDVPVRLWDERLSSVQAERSLKAAGLSHKKRKARLDQVAAALVLQSYLDAQSAV